MQHHSIVIQRRFVGLTLLASFLLFWGGAAFSIPLVDTKGISIFVLPPQQVLPVIAAHPQFWQWQSLLQLGGGVVASLGLVLLTLVLWAAHDRKVSLLGLMIFCFSIVLWVIIEAFRLGTGRQALSRSTWGIYPSPRLPGVNTPVRVCTRADQKMGDFSDVRLPSFQVYSEQW